MLCNAWFRYDTYFRLGKTCTHFIDTKQTRVMEKQKVHVLCRRKTHMHYGEPQKMILVHGWGNE